MMKDLLAVLMVAEAVLFLVVFLLSSTRFKRAFVALLVVWIAVLVIGVITGLMYKYGGDCRLSGPRSPFMGYDQEMQAQYDQLTNGMSMEEVVAKLGKEPYEADANMYLSGYSMFRDMLTETNEVSPIMFRLWINGGNWYYCIGFNTNNQVVVKREGHS